jgi:hypothetical protein
MWLPVSNMASVSNVAMQGRGALCLAQQHDLCMTSMTCVGAHALCSCCGATGSAPPNLLQYTTSSPCDVVAAAVYTIVCLQECFSAGYASFNMEQVQYSTTAVGVYPDMTNKYDPKQMDRFSSQEQAKVRRAADRKLHSSCLQDMHMCLLPDDSSKGCVQQSQLILCCVGHGFLHAVFDLCCFLAAVGCALDLPSLLQM